MSRIGANGQMETVSIQMCQDYDPARLRKSLNLLLEPLGGMAAFVLPGERVLLKPNLLSARSPERAVTTHPNLVRIVGEMVAAAGGVVMIGDSPGIGSFRKVAEKCGITQAAKECGGELVEFADTLEVHGGSTFKRLNLAAAYWEADKIINLPKLKTHEMMTMTCAVKNLFGAVTGTEKAGWHLTAGTSRELFARLLLEIYLLKKPALNIVDGIVAMEGNGPGSGDPVMLGVLLAGINPVAVDLVAGRLAGIPDNLLYIEREAEKMGLSGAKSDDIKIAGISPAEAAGRPFRLPEGLDVQFGLPRLIKNTLRHHITARPEADTGLCILCGICRDACPPGVIEIKNSALIIDHGRCIRCWCCRELCPHNAMKVHRGLLLKTFSFLRKRGKRA